MILNLSLWFGLHVLFGHVERLAGWFRPWVPDWAMLDWFSLSLSIFAAIALLRMKFSFLSTLALCGAIGAVWKLAL